jgi:hypothetical protein
MVLERKDIDGIVIGAPDHWNVPMTLDAVAAGKDSHNIGGGERAAKEVLASHQIVQAGYQQRAIFLHGNGAFRPAHAVGYGAPPTGTFSGQSVTLRRLRQTAHTLVEFEDADSWLQLTDGEERAALEELKPEPLLPLSMKEKVLGVMSPGPKHGAGCNRFCDCWIRWRRRPGWRLRMAG